MSATPMYNNLKRLLSAALLLGVCRTIFADEGMPSVSAVPQLPPSVIRGQTVTVRGSNLPTKDLMIALRTGREANKSDSISLPPATMDTASVAFKIPLDRVSPGRYLVYLELPATEKLPATELPVPGELRVLEDEAAKVQIDSVFPATVYPGETDHYTFYISGSNLGPLTGDNSPQLQLLEGGWQPLDPESECSTAAQSPSTGKPPAAATSGGNEPTDPTSTGIPSAQPAGAKTKPAAVGCLRYDLGMEGRKLTVFNFQPDSRFSEPVQLRLKVGNNFSQPVRLTFSRLGPTALKAWALVITVLIALVVLGLVWKGIGVYKIADEPFSPASAFLLDKQTNSYSLSKFQLLAWTSVAVFAYIFVYFCHVLVQWNFDFPAVPDGWPTLLGFSAATTVTAVGITANHGSKGAGPVMPSMADFISTGGLVATDRFQFFVWTLVGCAGFLGLILLQDPAALTTIPNVPAGFLYLMGISSAGYLGGKLVRAPGPVIAQLLVTEAAPGAPAALKLSLKGENLSTDATVNVDGQDLRKDQFAILPVKSQSSSPDSSFCAEITLTLKDAAAYLEGPHTLQLTNKDGQMAASTFPIDPLSFDPNKPLTVPPATTPQQLAVKGKNFADGMTASWAAPQQAAAVEIPSTGINKISDTELQVTLTPGPNTGAGKLTLISAIKLRATAPVTPKAAEEPPGTSPDPVPAAPTLPDQGSNAKTERDRLGTWKDVTAIIQSIATVLGSLAAACSCR